tara:strand:- start:314 stop:1960 length:1647 start_codon:yes stop_codon:yes gene_type:complete
MKRSVRRRSGQRRPVALWAAFCLFFVSASLLPASVRADLSDALRKGIDKSAHAAKTLRQAAFAEGLRSFYTARGHAPVWATGRGLTERGRAVMRLLSLAAQEGLEPGDYALAQEMRDTPTGGDEAAARREMAVAILIMKYAADVGDGRAYVRALKPDLFVFKEYVNFAAALRGAAAARDIEAYFATLPPAAPGYRALRDLLAVYRKTAASGGWPHIADGPVLKPGAAGNAPAVLRHRLVRSGDIVSAQEAPVPVSGIYEGDLVDAVKAFQKRHGLAADGIVGARTRKALNVPVDRRIRQIVLNMERLRWTPDRLGDPHVEVNLAGFELTAVRDGKIALRMPVIIGKSYRESPVFSDRISYLVLNPDWSVPRIIATQDILPKIRQSPTYLSDNGFRVFAGTGAQLDPATVDWSRLGDNHFPYRLQQAPGPRNALGTIKFMFPNRFSVYLHDTPERGLFAREVRTFSSGCIRVAQPAELAAFLLNSGEWDAGSVRREIQTGKTRIVRIARPVPIHLSYRTAWVDSGGTAQFRDDIYGRDVKLAAALFSGN